MSRMKFWRLHSAIYIYAFFLLVEEVKAQDLSCTTDLAQGQYFCTAPPIDAKTNELQGCTRNNTVYGTCFVVEGVNCTGDRVYPIQMPCRYTNGYYFKTAISLSVFLGVLGADRFYLGYPAIGLLKLFTFGGFFLGNLVDIILISAQVLKPADGSNYIFALTGPRMDRITISNQTIMIT
eukprot:Phypoly_transcript_09003.p1 GENE.Phypoly_transcript_09003~~Phypoly_transcript_09003.p1  ORF type:complete len:179 (-),score=17.30 Phypoly_transcript_09003:903-1439(-)